MITGPFGSSMRGTAVAVLAGGGWVVVVVVMVALWAVGVTLGGVLAGVEALGWGTEGGWGVHGVWVASMGMAIHV